MRLARASVTRCTPLAGQGPFLSPARPPFTSFRSLLTAPFGGWSTTRPSASALTLPRPTLAWPRRLFSYSSSALHATADGEDGNREHHGTQDDGEQHLRHEEDDLPRDSGSVLSEYVRALEPQVESSKLRVRRRKEEWNDPMTWDERVQQLLAYRREIDDFLPPFKSEHFPGLAQWLVKQQSLQYLKKLDKDKEAQLTAIGVPWFDFSRRRRPRRWWEQYEELRHFYRRFKHSRVPHMWEENILLSKWVKEQRALFCCRRLSFEQIHALEQLKFDWKITTWAWNKSFKELRLFKTKYGHYHVFRWKPAMAEAVVAKWMKSASGRAARRQLREELQAAGEAKSGDGTQDGGEEHASATAATLSQPYHDHDSDADDVDENEIEEDDDDIVDHNSLWEELLPADDASGAPRLDEPLRVPYSHEESAEEATEPWELSSQRLEKEREIDEEMRRQELHRERARVHSLRHWVVFQRQLYWAGRLKPVRVEALREIGFDFGKRPNVDDENCDWWKNYRQMAEIIKDNPRLRGVPKQQPKLYSWIRNARFLYYNGRLSAKRAAALEEADMLATNKNSWTRMLAKLQEFHRVHGHFNVPTKTHKMLWHWAAMQRYHKRLGQLQPDRVRALEDIGFSWGRTRGPLTAGRGRSQNQEETPPLPEP